MVDSGREFTIGADKKFTFGVPTRHSEVAGSSPSTTITLENDIMPKGGTSATPAASEVIARVDGAVVTVANVSSNTVTLSAAPSSGDTVEVIYLARVSPVFGEVTTDKTVETETERVMGTTTVATFATAVSHSWSGTFNRPSKSISDIFRFAVETCYGVIEEEDTKANEKLLYGNVTYDTDSFAQTNSVSATAGGSYETVSQI